MIVTIKAGTFILIPISRRENLRRVQAKEVTVASRSIAKSLCLTAHLQVGMEGEEGTCIYKLFKVYQV
jgi:hypothetical protein